MVDISYFWIDAGMVLICRILEHEQYPELMQTLSNRSKIKNSLDSGRFFHGDNLVTYEKIINIAKNYLSH